MEAWASAQYAAPDPSASAQLNAKALGKVHAIEEILELEGDILYHSTKEAKR